MIGGYEVCRLVCVTRQNSDEENRNYKKKNVEGLTTKCHRHDFRLGKLS